MSKELLAELRWKKKVNGMCKEGQATWEEYKNTVRACRDATRKAKAPSGMKSGKGCHKQQGLLQVHQQQTED